MVRWARRALTLLLTAVLVGACGSSSPSVAGLPTCSRGAVARVSLGASPEVSAFGAAGIATQRATVEVSVPSANRSGAFSSSRSLSVPPGWRVEAWARVPGARYLAWTPQHTLLVSVPDAGAVVELIPRAGTNQPPRRCVLIQGLTLPEGLAFASMGAAPVLYAAESDQVDRYAWRAGLVGARDVIARNLPDDSASGDDVHRLKGLTIGPDHRIYVNVGSADNASAQRIGAHPPRASVVSLSPDGGGMQVIATGVRNGEGLAIAPDGVLWAAINERDQMPYPDHGAFAGHSHAYGQVITAYVNEHPPDEVAALTPGRNVGWPFCDPDPSHGLGSMGFDDDPQTNPDGSRLDCARLAPIERGLPAHSAPLGFHFLQDTTAPAALRDGAILAVHGSWDRQPPRPPAVLWLPWSSTRRTLGAAVTLISGFQLADGSRWGRPTDAVAGPDGALYVSDDMAGVVYRVVP